MDGKRTLYYAAIAIAVLIALCRRDDHLARNRRHRLDGHVGDPTRRAGWSCLRRVQGRLVVLGDDNAPSIDSLERSRGSTSASAGDTSESRQDRLRRQYVEGQISEAEFERRIASELETEEFDDIDRELERER